MNMMHFVIKSNLKGKLLLNVAAEIRDYSFLKSVVWFQSTRRRRPRLSCSPIAAVGAERVALVVVAAAAFIPVLKPISILKIVRDFNNNAESIGPNSGQIRERESVKA